VTSWKSVPATRGAMSSRSSPWPTVRAGGQWPLCPADGGSPSHAAAGDRERLAGSNLAEQNDLFHHAVTAQQRGDSREAVAAYDRLLSKYPTGQLAEGAMVFRMRLLRSATPARAVAAARQYLATYPRGQARDEAEAIVAGAP